ncbi:PilZ domain-containing protein [Sphingomonas sp. EC-HK361]|uniref:PilZ domain-containing protein n=1 Tax=Sphingomonas sp. EC-HK361 TaxID=2038397 RepID=UPI0018FF1094|nr:PilZ domain-containing protein [Sphingomonas sp. EC-HK361]
MIHDRSIEEAVSPPPPAALQARAPRTNLFLSASIEADDASAPVRIRNLSETGAMIEGPAFPAIGSTLKLHRMEVDVDARLVWQAGPRAGIHFAGTITVAEWVSGKRAASGPLFGQTRVDAIQATIRTGTAPLVAPHPEPVPGAVAAIPDLERHLAEEIALVRRSLEDMGDVMTDDPIVVQRHHKLLQTFDLSCQVLDHIARILTAEDRGKAVAAVGMDELRARLTRG